MFSGGLDSILTTKLLVEQGIDVVALKFTSNFFGSTDPEQVSLAEEFIKSLGATPKIVHLEEPFLKVVRKPKHGYGKNMNPCVDCKILLLKRAKEIMEEIGASFVATGEVLGQRPMSQHGRALETIEKESGLKDILVRPLTAKTLEPTLPEREGWIDREKLLDFSGRSRKPQITLAKKFGITKYPPPAGGCLLADPNFSKRLKDLFENGTVDANNAEMLKLGRQFRLSPSFKLVIGRDERENGILMSLAKEDDVILDPGEIVAGATGLGRGVWDDAIIKTSAKIMARYIDSETGEVEVHVQDYKGKEKEVILASTPEDNIIKELMI